MVTPTLDNSRTTLLTGMVRPLGAMVLHIKAIGKKVIIMELVPQFTLKKVICIKVSSRNMSEKVMESSTGIMEIGMKDIINKTSRMDSDDLSGKMVWKWEESGRQPHEKEYAIM